MSRRRSSMDAGNLLDGTPAPKRPKNEDAPFPSAASEVDRINELPEGVLHHVLSLMPAHDAVRTCVLARRWRHLWRSAPAIRFTGVKGFTSADKFNQFVYRLLLLRRDGAPLDSCDFDFDSHDFGFRVTLPAKRPHLARWIRRALRRQVRALRICVGEFEDAFFLPHLQLFSRHLTRLELDCAHTNDSVLDFSGCPALVDLKMEYCDTRADEMSSSSLKRLSMRWCEFYGNDGNRTRMSLPSLVSLELIQCPGRVPLLESMPSLLKAVVRYGYDCEDQCDKGGSADCGQDSCQGCHGYYESVDDTRSCVFLKGLSEATDLELSAHPNVFVFHRDLKWCPTFTKLKTLLLNDWCMATDLNALICLMQHSPNLEKLTLQLSEVSEYSMDTEGSYNPLGATFTSDHIKMVEIKCEKVDGRIHNIFNILSAHGVSLQKINVQQTIRRPGSGCFNFVCTGFSYNEGFQLEAD